MKKVFMLTIWRIEERAPRLFGITFVMECTPHFFTKRLKEKLVKNFILNKLSLTTCTLTIIFSNTFLQQNFLSLVEKKFLAVFSNLTHKNISYPINAE